MILKSRENVGNTGGKGELGERKHCGMCALHISAIGQVDKYAILGGNFVVAGSVGAKEISGAVGVSDVPGLGGRN